MEIQKLEELSLNLRNILEIAGKKNASDIQFTAGSKPCIRINGVFEEVSNLPVLSPIDTIETAESIMTDDQNEKLKANRQIDLSFSGLNGRYRANVYFQRSSVSIAIRRLRTEIPTLEELNLPSFLREFMLMRNGLIVVSGPPSSGKSTTVASLLKYATERGVHIVTIEDPVEYLIPHKKAIVDQREVGTDVNSFEEGMFAVTRETPDIIFIGEIRDPESARISLSLATTGHLVITTLHAFPTAVAVDRLLSMLSDKEWNRKLFAINFVSIISQMLVTPSVAKKMYPICEVLVNSAAVRACIIENRLIELKNYMASGRNVLAQKSLEVLKSRGIITNAEYAYFFDTINNI